MRGSVRLAALAGLHVIYVWTHDSVGPRRGRPDPPAGRALRGAAGDPEPVVRPARRRQRDGRGLGARGRARDAIGPVALALTRQKLPTLAGTAEQAREGVRARRLRPARGDRRRRPQLILIGTGSELQLAFAAAEALEAEGIPTRVVSLPVLGAVRGPGPGLPRRRSCRRAVRKRVAVEAGVSLGWERWVGDEGAIVGLDHFGASAPGRHDLREVRLHGRARRGRRAAASSATGLRGRQADARRRRTASHPTLGDGRLRASDRTPSATRATAEPGRRCASRSPPTTPGPPSRTSCSRGSAAAGARPRARSTSAATAPTPTTTTRTSPRRLGLAVRDGQAERGILICGSGVGACVAANKMRGDPGRGLPRHVLGPPGRRARRHERADPRRAGHRAGAGLGVRRRVPRRRASAASRATAAGSTRSSRSRPERRNPLPGGRDGGRARARPWHDCQSSTTCSATADLAAATARRPSRRAVDRLVEPAAPGQLSGCCTFAGSRTVPAAADVHRTNN